MNVLYEYHFIIQYVCVFILIDQSVYNNRLGDTCECNAAGKVTDGDQGVLRCRLAAHTTTFTIQIDSKCIVIRYFNKKAPSAKVAGLPGCPD